MFLEATEQYLVPNPVLAAGVLLGLALVAGILNGLNAWSHRHNPNEKEIPEGWWTKTIFCRDDSDLVVFSKGMVVAPMVLAGAGLAWLIGWCTMTDGTPLLSGYWVALVAIVFMVWLIVAMHSANILGIFWWWSRRRP